MSAPLRARALIAVLCLVFITGLGMVSLSLMEPHISYRAPPVPNKHSHQGRICHGTTDYSPDCEIFGRVDSGSHGESNTKRDLTVLQKEALRLERGHQAEELALTHALASLDDGNMTYSIPKEMKTSETAAVTARIGVNGVPVNALSLGMTQNERVLFGMEKTKVSLHMKVTLQGPENDFTITTIGNEDQLVSGNEPTTWRWDITPKRGGNLHLHMTATAMLGDAGHDYKTIDKNVVVRVDRQDEAKQFVKDNWKWLLTTLGAGIGLLYKMFSKGAQAKEKASVKDNSLSDD